ncbi:MAG: ATP-binding protein [Verrucomicrobiota bacterium]|nr:ATP-binding protein [Verrucomicrobiota bacterium]
MTPAEVSAGAVLIVAPLGKDALLAAQILQGADIAAKACADLNDAAENLGETSTALLIAEEALVPAKLVALLATLEHQPPWSDIPVLVLTSSGGGERMSVHALDIFGPAGNVTLLERPLHGVTLISAVRVALRARRRQYEVRDLIREREAVLSSISDAFSAIDRDWRYTYVNERVAEPAGLSKEEMVGRKIWDVFPESVGGEFFELAHRAMETRQPAQAEFFHKPWNRWLDTRIYPTKAGIVIFGADITERKEQELLARAAQAKLRESEDLLRLATEAASIGTFDFYPLSGELRLSERARELLGFDAKTPANYANYLSAIHPEDRHLADETVRRVSEPGGQRRYDIEYRTVGLADARERWVAEKGRVVLDEGGRASRFIGTLLEITVQKNAEIALRRATQEAEAANRAKDHFLAMLSHELRTPLTPVLMTIAALRRDPKVSDHLRNDLEVLQRNVELEALLIDDLLDLTRISHGKLELHYDAVDVHSSIEHALTITAPELEAKGMIVTRRFEAREHHSWADAARLQQVFWNLLKNAAKFTPQGGRIDLRTWNDNAHRIIIEVADTGIGIEPALMPRIFDAFEQGGRRVTSQFGGLGLGLAISKRVIDMHGGTIAVASEGHDRGATFSITLQAMETSLLDGSLVLPLDAQRDQSVEILLVEDHADTARVLKRILEHAGYVVQHAASLAQARQLADERRFDVLVSDVGLPDGSGLELMRALKERGLSGIALSGFGMDDDRAASLAAGFSEHLTKPVDWPQLREAIERVLAARSHQPAAPAAVS